jgi:hypothetical protein
VKAPPKGGTQKTTQNQTGFENSRKRADSFELPGDSSFLNIQLSLIESHCSIASMGIPDAECLGRNAGTAEPMGVSPPEAVAYQVLVRFWPQTA